MSGRALTPERLLPSRTAYAAADSGYASSEPARAGPLAIGPRHPRHPRPDPRRAVLRPGPHHPWHLGGLTCECNLAPLCRHHHRAKQAWHLDHTTPGTLAWTAPSGHAYTTTPEPFPV
jgi:hypothetical protein